MSRDALWSGSNHVYATNDYYNFDEKWQKAIKISLI